MAGDVQQQLMRESRVVTPISAGPVGSTTQVPDIEEGHEAPFYRSIRFRLTMWYALALMVVVVGMALSLHSLLVRALTSDAETRLRTAASGIAQEINVNIDNARLLPDGRVDLASVQLLPPSYDSVLLSGLWFQVVGLDKQQVDIDTAGALTNPPDDLETALGESDIFGESEVYRTVDINDRKTLVLIAPMAFEVAGEPGPNAGWVIVGEPLGSRADIIEVVDSILRLLGAVGVVIAAWGGWLMAGRALAPLGRITTTAGSIANGDGSVALSKRLDVPESGDELTQLSVTFNRMLDRIESAFDTQRRFVSDASHELRTPLTSVRGNVDVLLKQVRSGRPLEEEDLVDVLEVVQRESGRMSRLIEDMLALARSDAGGQADLLKHEPVSLDLVAREAVRTAEQLASGQVLGIEVDDPPEISGDRDRLVQVVLIFLDNAIRYTPEGGTITVRVDGAADPESDRACARITVTDTGSGIDPKHIPHLFERFYRAEDARTRTAGGTGLGLSIALSIVRGHRGWIDVDSKSGEGTTFTVWLPVATDDPDAAEPETPRVRRPLRAVRQAIPKPRSRVFSRPLRRHP